LIFFISVAVVPLTGTVEISTTYKIETKQPTENTLERNGCDPGCKLQDDNITKNSWKNAHYYLWKDFTSAYTNLYVLKWSFWWALATSGFLQVIWF
jgi:Reduced folate carrier.